MIRQMIKIDEDKCNGCGLCADACHEGAIAIIDNKAKVLRDDYCDGLGNCLPVCPTGAITFEMREAAAFNNVGAPKIPPVSCGCPGTQAKSIERVQEIPSAHFTPADVTSQLNQWPCQIKLVPVNAPYFDNANLLIAADCTAYAYGNFHEKFMKNKITLIGCPKLDDGDYSEKLTTILKNNNIKSLTLTRMEVPCCGGLENAVITALKNSGKMIPWSVVTIGTNGEILD